MERLFKSVQIVKEEEYARAAEKFGPENSSDHESFAIILEEIAEASVEVKNTKEALLKFWQLVKNKEVADADKQCVLKDVENYAVFAACEFIQVAAMAYKAKRTIQRRGEKC